MIFLLAFFVAFTASASVLHRGLTGPQIAAYLQQNLSPASKIFLPSSPNYTQETTQRWNIYEEPTYIVSVQPALDTDVRKIIKYAGANKVPFLGTGGGHGYSTSLGALSNGIEIDLSLFSQIKLDSNTNTLTIGGSVTSGEFIPILYAAGKEIPTTGCSCVGALGATLGGGIGNLYGLHGPILDSLLSVHIVTGSGEIVDASRTHNTDLFWGVQGAGFNYGIVTSATFKVYPATNGGQLLNADMAFPAALNGSVWQLVSSFVGKQPNALSFDVSTLYIGAAGGTLLSVSAVYNGPEAEGMAIIQPFLDLKPVLQSINYVGWNESQAVAHFATDKENCIRGTPYSVYGVNLYEMNPSTLITVFNDFDNFYNNYPQYQASILVISQFPSAVASSVPDSATAFPYRDATAFSFLAFEWSSDFNNTIIDTFAKKQTARLGNSILSVYVNYAHGDEGPVAYYSPEKLGRLNELKEIWDPENLFGFYNGL